MKDINSKSYRVAAIDSVEPHPDNPRRGNVGLLEESIEEHGVYRPIIVQSSRNRIIAGEHTWRAAKEKGRERIAMIYLDVDDAEAKRIMLIDNRTSDQSVYDDRVLADLLAGLAEETGGLEGSGYDEATLADLQSRLDVTVTRADGRDAVPAAERLAQFEASALRQIVLIFDVPGFNRVVRLLAALRPAMEAETNTEIVTALVEAEAERRGIVLETDPVPAAL